ncbi:MAG: LysM peptidoglycan-binding domain-containing protein [Lachnospiraceae bacterium]|nr:LysM peptidoglycan-binding domain-containing protein [Lachnospiraceae bacterium]
MGELYNPFPKLPKNIRQIGDQDRVLRFYMEDYVATYLKKLYPTGKQTIRVGLLLGNVEYYDGTPYVFVDGAMEIEDVETDGERVIFSDSIWKKAYQQIEDTFPKRTIQGWFLCGGPGSQLSPLNYWKQHGQYFAGRNQLMYLNHGLDGEEAVYITSEDGFYRLKGHCIYYERNQMMQDYMITRKDVRRVESGSHEKVIKDFRSRMSMKKERAVMQSRTVSAMGILCGILSVAVLAGGAVLVNNYTKMQQMESVLASVLPIETSGEENDFIIEEMPGLVYPTEPSSSMQEESESAYEGNDIEVFESSTEESAESGEEEVTQQEITQPLVGMEKEPGEGDAYEELLPIDFGAAEANGYRVYEIGDGETLYGICLDVYGGLSHLDEICRLNRLENVDKILAGQKLILP